MPEAQSTPRTIWVTLTEATRYPASLPIPTYVQIFDAADDHGPFVVIRLSTVADAETWARWVCTEYRASLSADGAMAFVAERNGWAWHILAEAPAVLAEVGAS